MYELLNQTLGANIAIATDLDPGVPIVIADGNQLEVSILNLGDQCQGRDARRRHADDRDRARSRRTSAGVVLSVTDTGTGMPPEVIARAFDPFFTTKPPGKGTGLGLSQVYGLVRQMGGDVEIKSDVGKGTSIRLLLRRADAAADVAKEFKGPTENGHAERILVVDDDHDVRGIMTSFLSEIGYVGS